MEFNKVIKNKERLNEDIQQLISNFLEDNNLQELNVAFDVVSTNVKIIITSDGVEDVSYTLETNTNMTIY